MRIEDGLLVEAGYYDVINDEIIIPENVTEICNYAFSQIKNPFFKKILIPNNVIYIGLRAFQDCTNLQEVIISDRIKDISLGTFAGCVNLKKIIIPNSVNYINEEAFYACTNLEEINLPDSITDIGKNAFKSCSSLQKIKIPDKVKCIEERTFEECFNLESVIIPEGVVRIEGNAFGACEKLSNITLPSSLKFIEKDAFYQCIKLEEITIPDGVISIEMQSFRNCFSLKDVILPDSITNIGSGAFKNCRRLEKIKLPSEVTYIRKDTFKDCKKLQKIILSNKVVNIGESAFENCNQLEEINLPDTVVDIGNSAFKGCNFKKLTIPKNITYLGYQTFAQCGNLKEIIFPEILTSIGNGSFESCGSLEKVILPDSVESIHDNAFRLCRNLKNIKLSSNLDFIGNNAFDGCNNLEEVIIPEGVTSIGVEAFQNCTNLQNITIPESVKEIETHCFRGCNPSLNVKFKYKDKELNIDNASGVEIGICDTNLARIYNITREGQKPEYIIVLDSIEELISKGYIQENSNRKEIEREEIREQIDRIFKNNVFSKSANYNIKHAMDYIAKMIDALGLDNTEDLLKVPEHITEEEATTYGEKLLKVYQPKYELQGNITIALRIFNDIDVNLLRESENLNSDRRKIYLKINELLENETINIDQLLQACSQEIGLEMSERTIEKIKTSIQIYQLESKKDKIENKIKAKVDSTEHLVQRGISATLINNVIKKSILENGTIDEIEKRLNEEINKVNEDGELYYGASIRRQKGILLKLVRELYSENSELLNSNAVDILKNMKREIGDQWIRKLLDCRKGISDLKNLTKEEKEIFLENIKRNAIKIPLDFNTRYERNAEISDEEAYRILNETNIEGLLTYEKAEMMFSAMKEPYSSEFKNWFIKHKEEIMQDSNYYSQIAILHNEFERLLEDSNTRALYDNNTLTVEKAFEILSKTKKEVRKGNEELGKIAEKLAIETNRLKAIEDIFETTKQRERSYIPQVKSTKKRYRGRILRADDPMNLLAGNATNCCQKMGDVGAGSMIHGATENNGRIFVVEEIDEEGKVRKIVAQSWVWRNKDRICFDNIEISVAEQKKLKNSTEGVEFQKEILEIYKECAENLISTDEKMLKHLLEKGRITKEVYETLVLKDVTVGTGNNDLGVLRSSGLEIVSEEEIILPREKDKRYGMRVPWVDSGRDSVIGEGAQLYLAKSKLKRDVSRIENKYDLEDLPLLYKNEREVRRLKGDSIDDGVIDQIKEIEKLVYRWQQQMLDECEDYKAVANVYNMDKDEIEVMISREKDWYMIYRENDDEIYIADAAAINGVNSQNRGKEQTDTIDQTLEMTEAMYELMLKAAKQGKQIRLNATEDTSYKSIMYMVRKNLVQVKKDNSRNWGYCDDSETKQNKIIMHDMIISGNKEKLEEELKKLRERIANRKERKMLTDIENEVTI